MIRYTIAYAATAVVFLGVDYIWLSRAIGFYRNSLGDLLAEKPNLPAAAAFYLIYFVGIVVFAVMPAARNGGWVSALSLGGLLGLVAYATYDLTNLATLSRWPLVVVCRRYGLGNLCHRSGIPGRLRRNPDLRTHRVRYLRYSGIDEPLRLGFNAVFGAFSIQENTCSR